MENLSENVEKCLDYILNSELADFRENANDNHVYFHAFAAWYGIDKANAMLTEALITKNTCYCGRLNDDHTTFNESCVPF